VRRVATSTARSPTRSTAEDRTISRSISLRRR
jgi:hypothetical protein